MGFIKEHRVAFSVVLAVVVVAGLLQFSIPILVSDSPERDSLAGFAGFADGKNFKKENVPLNYNLKNSNKKEEKAKGALVPGESTEDESQESFNLPLNNFIPSNAKDSLAIATALKCQEEKTNCGFVTGDETDNLVTVDDLAEIKQSLAEMATKDELIALLAESKSSCEWVEKSHDFNVGSPFYIDGYGPGDKFNVEGYCLQEGYKTARLVDLSKQTNSYSPDNVNCKSGANIKKERWLSAGGTSVPIPKQDECINDATYYITINQVLCCK